MISQDDRSSERLVRKQFFISYSRANEKFANRLYISISNRGYQVWLDTYDIDIADHWWETIKENIIQADAFIFIISKESILSPVCNFELREARQHHKKIIPVLHEWPGQYPNITAAREYIAKEVDAVSLTEIHEQIRGKTPFEAILYENWSYLSSINFANFADGNKHEVVVENLIADFKKDKTYLRQHTRLLERALVLQRDFM